MSVSLNWSNVADLALSLSRLTDGLTACSAMRCLQCNCFAYDLTRLCVLACFLASVKAAIQAVGAVLVWKVLTS